MLSRGASDPTFCLGLDTQGGGVSDGARMVLSSFELGIVRLISDFHMPIQLHYHSRVDQLGLWVIICSKLSLKFIGDDLENSTQTILIHMFIGVFGAFSQVLRSCKKGGLER